jgi:hypothetical protein
MREAGKTGVFVSSCLGVCCEIACPYQNRGMGQVCVGLRKSQVKTLAELVAAALVMPRVSLAELGRRLAASTCKTAKHCIKRAWRFTSNERIHIPDAMQGPLRWLFRQRRV